MQFGTTSRFCGPARILRRRRRRIRAGPQNLDVVPNCIRRPGLVTVRQDRGPEVARPKAGIMASHTAQMQSRSGPGAIPLAAGFLLLSASCTLKDTVAPNDTAGTRGVSAQLSGGSAQDFYASPTGSPSGDGSLTNAWDLTTALAGPAAVTPGSTIWLRGGDRKSTRLNSSHTVISYAVFCLKKKKKNDNK